jgi:hypothetical protein
MLFLKLSLFIVRLILFAFINFKRVDSSVSTCISGSSISGSSPISAISIVECDKRVSDYCLVIYIFLF